MISKEIQLKNNLICTFRQPKEDDAQKILDYMNTACTETDFLSFGKGELTWTLEQENKFIKDHNDDNNKLIIIAEVSDKMIGMASITDGKPKRIQHIGELGITVSIKYWSHGIGQILMEYLIG